MTDTSTSYGDYTLDLSCQNCGWEGRKAIKKGLKVKEAMCPTCGCCSLSRKIDSYFFPSRFA